MPYLARQRPLLPSAQVSEMASGVITLPSRPLTFAENKYQSIASVTLTSGTQANFEFTSVPTGYRMYQIRLIGRSDRNVNDLGDGFNLEFNNDTGANYAYNGPGGENATATATRAHGSNAIFLQRLDSGTSTFRGMAVIDIFNPTATNVWKVTATLGGMAYSTTTNNTVTWRVGTWRSTSAITSIKLTPTNGNFTAGSTAGLYGVLE